MDFVVGLLRTLKKFDAIWVIVDRLTKSAHFIPVCTTYSSERLAEIYIREIVRLHGVPVSIISDRGTQFTLKFWRAVQRELGTQVELSILFTLRQTGSPSALFRYWRTCCVLVSLILEGHGISVYRSQSLLIITVISQVLRWLHMRLCMRGSVDLRSIGLSHMTLGFWVQTWCRML